MRRPIRLAALCLVVLCAAPCGAGWSDAFHDGVPLPGPVNDAVGFEGRLVICGPFTDGADGVPLDHVAVWDAGWRPLGAGLPADPGVLLVHDGELWAGAHRWDGAAWVRELPPVDTVTALAFLDGEPVFAFELEGSHRVYRREGPLFLPLGEFDGPVEALATHDGRLVAGGAFETADGVACRNVARLEASDDWAPLGAGLHGDRTVCCGPGGISWDLPATVRALRSHGGVLHAAGSFTHSGGAELASVARWTGGAWEPLGAGLDAPVTAVLPDGTEVIHPPQALDLAVFDGLLHVGGIFAGAGGAASGGLVAWDGAAWRPAGAGVDLVDPAGVPTVRRLCPLDDALVALGSFDRAGGGVVRDAAAWDGALWTAGPGGSGLGVDGSVWVLQPWAGGLVAGGLFASAGGAPLSNLAFFDGGNWRPLGDADPDQAVRAAIPWNGGLLVGGAFREIDGRIARYAAFWDGAAWSPMDAGLETPIYDFAIHAGELYAGTGPYLPPSPAPKFNPCLLYRWDADRWTPLQPVWDPGWGVWDLEVWNEQLWLAEHLHVYVWTDPGVEERFGQRAFRLHAQGPKLWAGTDAVSLAGDYWNCLLRRDGDAWSAVGVFGLRIDEVRALADLDGVLYVGGRFETVDDLPVNHVFRLDGDTPTPLDGGLDGRALCAVAHDGSVWFGGDFTAAGGFSSTGVARWTPDVVALEPHDPPADPLPLPAPTGLTDVRPNPFNPRTRIAWTQARPGPVELAVYDLKGRRVAVLAEGERGAGPHALDWDGRDDGGRALPSGAYVLRLEADGTVTSRKAVLAR